MPNPFNLLNDDSDDETVVVKTTTVKPTTVVVNKEKPFVLSACPCPNKTVVASPTKRWADYDTDDDDE
jgi:hypothetical protein